MGKPRLRIRYRVNIEIEVKDATGKLYNEPHHIGFWIDLPTASQVITGLDLHGLAFNYRHKPGYTPTGRATTVIAKCEFTDKNELVSHESVVRSTFNYTPANVYTNEYEVTA